MKKYLILSFLFLLVTVPVLAKSATSNLNAQGQVQNQVQTRDPVVSPTGQQIQNRNQVQTQNQGEDQQLNVQTQESEQSDQDEIDESIDKVSQGVKKLLEDRGDDKTGIGQQVKEIAQIQEKNQEKIKSTLYELKNRGQIVRLFVGSDKKMTAALGLMIEDNRLIIEKLIALKDQTVDEADETQLKDAIGSLLTQNSLLEEKINAEKQATGILGWFTRLFSRK